MWNTCYFALLLSLLILSVHSADLTITTPEELVDFMSNLYLWRGKTVVLDADIDMHNASS